MSPWRTGDRTGGRYPERRSQVKSAGAADKTKVWCTLIAAFLAVSGASGASDGCADAPPPVAACHAVHGRLDAYNGRWGAVIWVVGTRHLLGVLDDRNGDLLVPDNVVLDRADEVYGDFTVCPLVTPRIGHIEEVCVQAARRLVVKHAAEQPRTSPDASAAN